MDPQALAPIAARHGITLVVQFGSTVTGHAHAMSDVDLAVLLDAGPFTLSRLGGIATDLQALSPDREVDVVLLNRADPLLLKKIIDTGRLVYGPSRRFAELKMSAFKRYQDHRRFLALERAYVATALRRAPR